MRCISKYSHSSYIGKTYNSLLILSGAYGYKGNYKFSVQCSCGRKFLARAQHVVDSKIKTCSNCRPQCKKKSGFTASFLSTYRNRAIKQGREFTLTPEVLQEQFNEQKGLCALTGDILTLPTNSRERSEFNVSIDRVDSKKGYTPDNIQLVTKKVNMAKQNMSQEDFLVLCLKVANCKGGSCGV